MATGIVTTRFRIHNAEQFYESLSEASPSRLFMFVGRPFAWANDSAAPSITDTVQNVAFNPYRDTYSYKRVQTSDASYVSIRNNWANNTLYTEYRDDNSTLANSAFFVATDSSNVYKCIDNNRSANSTVKPTGTGTSIITCADGYRWKYMFTISGGDMLKFATTNFLPVKVLTANDDSAQWSVQQAASNGAIHHVRVTANGSGYLFNTNTFQTVTNSTSVRLGNNASTVDGKYVGSTVFINAGLGIGQLRLITAYVGSTRRATMNNAFTTTPNTSSRYVVTPRVIIRGDSGVTTSLRATAYVSNVASGQIRKVTMISEGNGYSTANAVVTDSTGSGATIVPVISPFGGHGKDAVDELYGFNIMLNTQFIGAEANSLPTNNDFRVVGLIRDPLLRGGLSANVSIIDGSTRLTVEALDGDLTADERLSGGTSLATGKFLYFANTNTARTKGIVRVVRVVTGGTGKQFAVGELITGATSGKTATITAVDRPAIRENTGDVIYIENREPISRSSSQTEDFKLVVKF